MPVQYKKYPMSYEDKTLRLILIPGILQSNKAAAALKASPDVK